MNKHLINAARYIDAIHNISVDESSLELDKIIDKHRVELNSQRINQYWDLYLKDMNLYPVDVVSDEEEKEEKVIYYRGVAQTVLNESITTNDAKKSIYYRGAKVG